MKETDKQNWEYEALAIKLKIESENIQLFELEESPITVVKQDGVYTVLLGNSRLSEGHENLKEAVKDARSLSPKRVLQLAEATFKILKQTENE